MTGTLTIRADASPAIGTGHVMRMIALGQAWRDAGGAVRFVGDVGSLADRLLREGFLLHQIPAVHPEPADLATLLDLTDRDEWIAIDGYHFDTGYQRAVRAAGRHTLVVDDVADRGEYEADFLLNQNADAARYHYTVNTDAVLLLGPRYSLLRKEFLTALGTCSPIPTRAQNILVTFGGSDFANVTAKALTALENLNDSTLHIKVVAGASNPHLADLKKRICNLPGRSELLASVDDMPSIMRWADLAVSAAGSTIWELCSLGVPFIAVKTAENQNGIYRTIRKQGLWPCLTSTDTATAFADALNSVISDRPSRTAMRKTGTTYVDGRGAMRVAGTLYARGISLRTATKDDAETLLQWRNAPKVRKQFFNTATVCPAEHKAWLAKKLVDPDCLFYIGVDGRGSPVGQIRFDCKGNAAAISINTAPNRQGMGIGTTLLRLACEALAYARPGLIPTAEVKKDNAASSAMFMKAGFKQTGCDDDGLLIFTLRN